MHYQVWKEIFSVKINKGHSKYLNHSTVKFGEFLWHYIMVLMDYMDSLSKCDGSSITRNKETKIYQYHLLYHSQLKNKSHWYDTCIVTPVLINITSSKPTSSSMAATSWGSGIAPGGAHSSRKENLSMPDLIRNLSTNFFSFTIMASFSASSTWVVSFCFHSSKAQANSKSTFYIIKWQSMTCKNSFKSDW